MSYKKIFDKPIGSKSDLNNTSPMCKDVPVCVYIASVYAKLYNLDILNSS